MTLDDILAAAGDDPALRREALAYHDARARGWPVGSFAAWLARCEIDHDTSPQVVSSPDLIRALLLRGAPQENAHVHAPPARRP